MRAFLAVIRSLGRFGIEVHVGWFADDDPALSSRYVRKAHLLPPPGAAGWVHALRSLTERERFNLVIPCDDAGLLAIHQHRSLFEGTLLAIPDDRSVAVLFDKFESNMLARSVGAHVPQEIVVTSADAADAVLAQLGAPVVVKPKASHDPSVPALRRRVRRADTPEQLRKVLDEMLPSGPVSVQQFFRGRGVGVELLMDGGEPLLAFQHVRVHEPMHGGGSSYRKSVPPSPELLTCACRILKATEFSGVAMVEFRVDDESGKWIFVEVNARFWGSLPLAVAAGADFPRALFEFMVEGRRSFAPGYRTGLFCRNLMSDLLWQIVNLRANRADESLASVPLRKVFVETVVNWLSLRERFDEFSWDDPLPAIRVLRGLLARIPVVLKRYAARSLAGLPPYRYVLQRRSRRALLKAGSVLFVCKGNICRSPFAERLAQRLLPRDVAVSSAGYYPKEGRRAPAAAISVAAELGIDLTDSASRVLTESDVRNADVIFVFDKENAHRVAELFPSAKRKLHLLGALNARGCLYVIDPWSGDEDRFRKVYLQIRDALASAVGKETIRESRTGT